MFMFSYLYSGDKFWVHLNQKKLKLKIQKKQWCHSMEKLED